MQDQTITNLTNSIAYYKEAFLSELNETIDELDTKTQAAYDNIIVLEDFVSDRKCKYTQRWLLLCFIAHKHAPFQKKRVKQSTKPPRLTKEIESEIPTESVSTLTDGYYFVPESVLILTSMYLFIYLLEA